MTKSSTEAPFTLKRVQQMLGLPRTTVARLIEAGYVTPERGPRNAYCFSFQDLMLLRTAFALQQASIPPRKIVRSLAKLKSELPHELPLTGLRITAVGADVAVRDRHGQLQADTGQLLMDFEVSTVGGTVSVMPKFSKDLTPPKIDWFLQGVTLEPEDLAAAEVAYRRAIIEDPSRSAPFLNLGAMLCEAGRCNEAVELYERAVKSVGHDPLIHFNHAIALEDQRQFENAISAYERLLNIDGNFADAHYNLALLYEKQGDDVRALRHFNAFRRLELAKVP